MKYEENIDLTNYNTYRIKTKAKYLIKPSNIEELISIITNLTKDNIPYYILGSGSNVILPDTSFKGAIIKLDNLNSIIIKDNYCYVSSGLSLNNLVLKTLDAGFTNLTNLYGIPGSVGGAIVCNAGANNKDIFSDIKAVLVYKDGLVKLINKNNIKYEYRNTEFKNSNTIILGAVLKLEKGNVDSAKDLIKTNLEKRKNTQPLEYPQAGSVFKNPPNNYAGKLIEECNLKNVAINGARVSNKHANFIINDNNATSKDIINLINKIKEEVKTKKNIELELEQVIVKW